MPTEDRRSPLHDRHLALGARMGGFGGWLAPLDYPGGGVLREHAAVRERVGVFDVSHLGSFRLRRPGAGAAVDAVLTNDLGRVGPGRAQYSMLCDPAGGVVDDLMVLVLGEDDLLVVPNAANAAVVAAALGVPGTGDHRCAVLAVQGPRAREAMAAVGLPTDLPPLGLVEADGLVVCRSGYTGEVGFEVFVPLVGAPSPSGGHPRGGADRAGALWDALLAAGCTPCGLGARDTLRTEMGFPLHGQDLGPDITPVEAGLGWAVGWDKPAFAGRTALLAERAAGPRRAAYGLRAVGGRIPRPGMVVRDAGGASGAVLGTVTSGTFSPTLRTGIALALLRPDVAVGARLVVDVRGRDCPVTVVRPPFVPSHVRDRGSRG